MIKISIIIPAYNVEKYIKQCLDSCINQVGFSKDEYEIILINDGSKDNTMDVINKDIDWKGVQYTILEQDNQGQSVARNKGLSLAKGDYIWFVDSDDWVSENSLFIISQNLVEDIDGLFINGADYEEGGSFARCDWSDVEERTMLGKDFLCHKSFNVCPPLVIYKREFLQNLPFRMVEGIFYEDSEYMPKVCYYSYKQRAINDVLYYIRKNPTSTTRSINPKRVFDLIVVSKSLAVFAKKVKDKKYKRIFYSISSTALNNCLNQYVDLDDNNKISLKKELQSNKKLFTSFFKSSRLKHKVQGVIFLLFGYNIIPAYKFMSFFVK